MITENISTLKINKLTQAQYDREFAAGRIDENALYLTPDTSQEELNGKVNQINYLAAGADLNTVTTTGVYRLESGHVNAPNDGDHGYGQMFVGHGGGDTIFQMIVSFGTAKVFVRAGNPSDVGGAGSWTTWKTLDTPYREGYGGNLDELFICGNYYIVFNSVSGTLPPSGSYGILEVFRHDATGTSATIQRFTSCATSEVYYRFNMNGWQPWIKLGGGAGSWQTWTSGTLLTNYSDISIRVRVDSDARPSGTYVVVNIPTAMLSTATAKDDYFSMTVVTQGGTWEDNCFWGTLYVKVNAANNGITVTIDGLAHRLNGSPIIKVR